MNFWYPPLSLPFSPSSQQVPPPIHVFPPMCLIMLDCMIMAQQLFAREWETYLWMRKGKWYLLLQQTLTAHSSLRRVRPHEPLLHTWQNGDKTSLWQLSHYVQKTVWQHSPWSLSAPSSETFPESWRCWYSCPVESQHCSPCLERNPLFSHRLYFLTSQTLRLRTLTTCFPMVRRCTWCKGQKTLSSTWHKLSSQSTLPSSSCTLPHQASCSLPTWVQYRGSVRDYSLQSSGAHLLCCLLFRILFPWKVLLAKCPHSIIVHPAPGSHETVRLPLGTLL